MALDSHGHLIVALAYAGITTPPDPVSKLFRFDPATLALDPSFGNAGAVTLDPAQFGLTGALILAAAQSDYTSMRFGTFLLRIDSTGQAVRSFGSGGAAALPQTSAVTDRNLLVENTGEILLLNNLSDSAGPPEPRALLRFKAGGSLDSMFDASSIPNPLAIALDSSNGESPIVAGSVTLTRRNSGTRITYPTTAYVTRVEL